MSAHLAYLFWLLGLTVAVFLITGSPKRRRWRKKLLLVAVGVWLVSAGFLMAGIFQKRPFFDAVKSGDFGRVKELLADKPTLIRSKTFLGDTALHMAVTSGNTNMVAVLLDAGADVNAKGDSNVTPLHLAAFSGNAQIAEALLKAHADVNAVGYRHNDTPLHVAALHGHASVVKLLLAHGADASAVDMLHKTPLQLAQENQKTNVIAVLTNPPPPKQ
jgi:ankyrin repeat protein